MEFDAGYVDLQLDLDGSVTIMNATAMIVALFPPEPAANAASLHPAHIQ